MNPDSNRSLLPALLSSGDTELLYRALVEELPAFTYVNDFASKTCLFASEQAEMILGLDPAKMIAGEVHFTDHIEASHRADVMRRTDEATAKGEDIVIEYPFRRPDGQLVWIREYLMNILGPDGRPALQEGFMINVTETRKMQARLAEVQRLEALGRMAGGIVHDFNTILAIVKGSAELINKQPDDQTTILAAASEIERAADRASLLTQQLLAFSRKKVTAAATCNIVKIVADNLSIFRAAAGEQIAVRLKLPEEEICIPLGEAQAVQVLINLVVNGREAIGTRPGVIAVECSKTADGRAEIRVCDSGHGVDDEVREKMFEPFFSTKEEGTGLGLATVWGVITGAEGEIAVERCEELGGVCFRLTLPLAEPPAALEPAAAIDKPTVATVDKPVALIVDDEPALRMIVEGFLRPEGWEVHSASDASSALDLIDQGLRPTLLITDVVMRGMTGTDLARKLRESHPDLPVLLISAYPGSDDIQQMLRMPGVRFLEKPFEVEELLLHSSQLCSAS